MFKYSFFVILFALILATLQVKSQNQDQPKLIVGIVVDQMRPDYISRYWQQYGDGGFKRLVNQGYNFANTHYSYVPTYTAPGHATIFTGTTPSGHGIISNDWFSREKGDNLYCTEDATVSAVRSPEKAASKNTPKQMMPQKFKEKTGQMSPRNMIAGTFGDELRLFNNLQSKVVGIALKDRGSILPAGHTGNAYWFDGESGEWISSTFYHSELPKWLNDFNALNLTENYLGQTWKPLLPLKEYTSSLPDDNPYEGMLKGKKKPVFPYNLKELAEINGKGIIRVTPFGNSLTKEIAIAAIKGENLGKGNACDMLTVSFSSTDYVGHNFGIDAIETQDTYLRLDRDLEELFNFIDQWVGMNNCLIFLTADHGGARNPSYLSDLKMPAGYIDFKKIKDSLNTELQNIFGSDKLILSMNNDQVYFNHAEIFEKSINYENLLSFCERFILNHKGVQDVYRKETIRFQSLSEGNLGKIQRGFMPKRSGDLLILLEPSWMDYPPTGTTHGSNHSYDTHVPLLFMGWKIPKGKSSTKVHVEDIAPSISQWLNIAFPNACSGKPLELKLMD